MGSPINPKRKGLLAEISRMRKRKDEVGEFLKIQEVVAEEVL